MGRAKFEVLQDFSAFGKSYRVGDEVPAADFGEWPADALSTRIERKFVVVKAVKDAQEEADKILREAHAEANKILAAARKRDLQETGSGNVPNPSTTNADNQPGDAVPGDGSDAALSVPEQEGLVDAVTRAAARSVAAAVRLVEAEAAQETVVVEPETALSETNADNQPQDLQPGDVDNPDAGSATPVKQDPAPRPDFSTMTKSEILEWADANGVKVSRHASKTGLINKLKG